MTSYEVEIPAKRRLDVQDTLLIDHGIDASIEPAREGRWVITVMGQRKDVKSTIQDVLTNVGGEIVED